MSFLPLLIAWFLFPQNIAPEKPSFCMTFDKKDQQEENRTLSMSNLTVSVHSQIWM